VKLGLKLEQPVNVHLAELVPELDNAHPRVLYVHTTKQRNVAICEPKASVDMIATTISLTRSAIT
jgi:hypothetical protein